MSKGKLLSEASREALCEALNEPPCTLLDETTQETLKTIFRTNATISAISEAVKNNSELETRINTEGNLLRNAYDQKADPFLLNPIERWLLRSMGKTIIEKATEPAQYFVIVPYLEHHFPKCIEQVNEPVEEAAQSQRTPTPQRRRPPPLFQRQMSVCNVDKQGEIIPVPQDQGKAVPAASLAEAVAQQQEAMPDILLVNERITSFSGYAHYIAQYLTEGKELLLKRLEKSTRLDGKNIQRILSSDSETLINKMRFDPQNKELALCSIKDLAECTSQTRLSAAINKRSHLYITAFIERIQAEETSPLKPSEYHLLQYICCVSQSMGNYRVIMDQATLEEKLTDNFFTRALHTCIERRNPVPLSLL